MTEYADLEIGLHRRNEGSYVVEFRYSQPNSEADVRFDLHQPTLVAIDLDEHVELNLESDAYS